MKKILLSISFLASIVAYSQVGINTTDPKVTLDVVAKATDAVLVLESTNKALVLPHVTNPHLTVKSPYPGMMCYDTVKKAVAVFDGTVWNYWK